MPQAFLVKNAVSDFTYPIVCTNLADTKFIC